MEVMWEVASRGEGIERKEVLFTYNEDEREEVRIAKNNAGLVLNPKFIPLYPKLLVDMDVITALVYGFIDFFLENNERFYCTNEQLAQLFRISESTIKRSIQTLQEKKYIKCKYRIKAGGGKIRFIELPERVKMNFQKVQIDPSERSNWPDIYNNIINNNLSISNDIDYISSPQDKIEGSSIKQKSTDNTPNLPQNPLPSPVVEFLKDSYNVYPSIKYQIDKNPEKYKETTMKDYEKLCKEYGEDTVQTVLRFIKQDEFRSKQIQSVSKLRKKNKDWIPYIVVMMDKIKDYKPNVLDLDAITWTN